MGCGSIGWSVGSLFWRTNKDEGIMHVCGFMRQGCHIAERRTLQHAFERVVGWSRPRTVRLSSKKICLPLHAYFLLFVRSLSPPDRLDGSRFSETGVVPFSCNSPLHALKRLFRMCSQRVCIHGSLIYFCSWCFLKNI